MATKNEQEKMAGGGDAIAGIEAFNVYSSVVDGVAIFEGDIALGTVDQMEQVRSSMMKDNATMADASIMARRAHGGVWCRDYWAAIPLARRHNSFHRAESPQMSCRLSSTGSRTPVSEIRLQRVE